MCLIDPSSVRKRNEPHWRTIVRSGKDIVCTGSVSRTTLRFATTFARSESFVARITYVTCRRRRYRNRNSEERRAAAASRATARRARPIVVGVSVSARLDDGGGGGDARWKFDFFPAIYLLFIERISGTGGPRELYTSDIEIDKRGPAACAHKGRAARGERANGSQS